MTAKTKVNTKTKVTQTAPYLYWVSYHYASRNEEGFGCCDATTSHPFAGMMSANSFAREIEAVNGLPEGSVIVINVVPVNALARDSRVEIISEKP